MRRIITIAVAVIVVFGAGFLAGASRKPAQASFHDLMVNHPRDLSALITPKDKRVRALASELQTPENAYAYVRDRVGNDPSLATPPAGDIIAEGQASCLGKAVLLCSLYRAMGIPSSDVRVVTGELGYPGSIIEHVWVDMEYNGMDLQQDATNLLGHFHFEQFRGMEYARTFMRREGYAFNDVSFAVVSQLNLLKGMGHPPAP